MTEQEQTQEEGYADQIVVSLSIANEGEVRLQQVPIGWGPATVIVSGSAKTNLEGEEYIDLNVSTGEPFTPTVEGIYGIADLLELVVTQLRKEEFGEAWKAEMDRKDSIVELLELPESDDEGTEGEK